MIVLGIFFKFSLRPSIISRENWRLSHKRYSLKISSVMSFGSLSFESEKSSQITVVIRDSFKTPAFLNFQMLQILSF